jgi:hypothetical protein
MVLGNPALQMIAVLRPDTLILFVHGYEQSVGGCPDM